MYELHSRHENPEPQSICGSLDKDPNKEIFVTTYHQSWLPLFLGMALHHYQVQCTFKSLDFHVRTEGPKYSMPVGYSVDYFDYDSLNYRHVESKIPKVSV